MKEQEQVIKNILELKKQLKEEEDILKSLKTKTASSDVINLDEPTARRMYPNFSKEIQRILENKFGKNFHAKPAKDFIKNYQDICDELQVNSDDSEIKIEVPEFNEIEIKVVKSFIKKMRISKVYNKGKLPTKKDKRYYYWHEFSSSAPSGLRFGHTHYDDVTASATSAAHLSFLEDASAKDVGTKFVDIDADFYALK